MKLNHAYIYALALRQLEREMMQQLDDRNEAIDKGVKDLADRIEVRLWKMIEQNWKPLKKLYEMEAGTEFVGGFREDMV